MKKILAGIIIVLASASGAISQNTKPRTWYVKITPHTSKKYIDSVVTEWRKCNIDLGFINLAYDSKGVLESVEGTVLNRTVIGQSPSSYNFRVGKIKQALEITVTDTPSITVLMDGR